MTEELFRDDSYLKSCQATVTAVGAGGIELDRTVFYATGGGQAGDTGTLEHGGGTVEIVDTHKDRETGAYLHVPAIPAHGAALPAIGDTVTAEINWQRRHRHMRMHSCLHLLCSVIDGGVTGGSITEAKGRLDFDIPDAGIDKEALSEELNKLARRELPVTIGWISDEDLAAQPDLVRTWSVRPPKDTGKVRMIAVGDVDLQPCGGTHVANTREIGPLQVSKIEKKGARNRRVRIVLS